MDPRSNLFKPHSDTIAHNSRLAFIENNLIKAPIAIWIAKDPNRIQLLKKAIKDSFAPEMQDYQELTNAIKKMLERPQDFLRNIPVDNPELTMKRLIEQASSTAITEYMNTHPEYEEKLNQEIVQEAESVKKTSQSRDEKTGKDSKIVPNVSQPHHQPSDVVTNLNSPSSRPKVR